MKSYWDIYIKGMVALLVSAIVFFSCGENVSRIGDIGDVNKIPGVRLDSLEMTYLSDGKIRQRIRTPLVQRFSQLENPYDEFPRGGYVESYNDSLQLETTIFAKYAICHTKPVQQWMAIDSVVVHNFVKGQSVYTDTLYWDMEKKEIYTNCPVKIVTPEMTLFSEHGMRSDDQFRDYELRTIRNSELFYNKDELNKKGEN